MPTAQLIEAPPESTRSAPVASQQPQAGETQLDAVRLAIADVTPMLIALVPFSLAIGTASAEAGLSGAQAVFGALALLAGTAQLAAVQLLGGGAGLWLVVATVAMINIRFALYGTGPARWFAEAPARQRFLLASLIVDQTFILGQDRFTTSSSLEWRRRYYLTASGMLAGTFVTTQIVGYNVGILVPPEWGLSLAAPLAFAGMLAKTANDRSSTAAAVAGGAAIVVLNPVAGALSLPLAVAAGMVVGLLAGMNRDFNTEEISEEAIEVDTDEDADEGGR